MCLQKYVPGNMCIWKYMHVFWAAEQIAAAFKKNSLVNRPY